MNSCVRSQGFFKQPGLLTRNKQRLEPIDPYTDLSRYESSKLDNSSIKKPLNGRIIQEFDMFNENFNNCRPDRTMKINTNLNKRAAADDWNRGADRGQVSQKMSKLTSDEDYNERQKSIENCVQKLNNENYDMDSYLDDFLRIQFCDKF